MAWGCGVVATDAAHAVPQKEQAMRTQMMTPINISIRISDEAIRDHYIQTGEMWENTEWVRLSHDQLTQESRAILAKSSPLRKYLANTYIGAFDSIPHVQSPEEAHAKAPEFVERVLIEFDSIIQKAVESLMAITDPLERAKALHDMEPGDRAKLYFGWSGWKALVRDSIPEEVKEEMDNALLASTKAKEAEAAASRAAEAARVEAEKLAGEERLKEWALEHGSPLLKARIEEEFSWQARARQEFAKWVLGRRMGHKAGWRAKEEEWSITDRMAPSLKEIRALQRARERYADAPVVFSLVWVTTEEGGNGRAMLHAEVTCPDGKKMQRLLPL